MTNPTAPIPQLPTAWANEPVLDGVDLVDKAALIGVPFLITSVWFEVNKRQVRYVYVDGELANGDPITFNDSSSGVLNQIIEVLQTRGLDNVINDVGTVAPFRLVIPRGLRVSQFEVFDERGRAKQAKTYYLTTSGVRRAAPQQPEQPAAAQPATTRQRKNGNS